MTNHEEAWPGIRFHFDEGENNGGGNDGGGDGNWYDGLPDDLKGNANVTKYDSLDKAVRGHLAALEMVGNGGKEVIPTDTDEMIGYVAKLGRPEKADDYTIVTDDMPDILKGDAPLVKAFGDAAFDVGLPPSLATRMLNSVAKHVVGEVETMNANAEAQATDRKAAMVQAWGKTDSSTHKQNMARVALADEQITEAVLGRAKNDDEPSLMDVFKSAGIGDHPMVLKAMSHLGTKALTEDISGDNRGSGSDLDADTLKSQATELLRQANDPSTPTDKARELSARAAKLFGQARASM